MVCEIPLQIVQDHPQDFRRDTFDWGGDPRTHSRQASRNLVKHLVMMSNTVVSDVDGRKVGEWGLIREVIF